MRPRRRPERGFALISAVVLAILYFMLMELLLLDAQRQLKEAQRFRANVHAYTLAENAAELAAERMTQKISGKSEYDDETGEATGTLMKTAGGQEDGFLLIGRGTSAGVVEQQVQVELKGRVLNQSRIIIDYSTTTRPVKKE